MKKVAGNFLSAKKWTVLSGNKKIRHKYSAFKESSEENQNLKETMLKLTLLLKTASIKKEKAFSKSNHHPPVKEAQNRRKHPRIPLLIENVKKISS